MEKLVLDSTTLARLGNLEQPLGLYDETGKFLAYLTPAASSLLECPYDDDEIERRSQEQEEYTTAEVFERLKKL